LGLAEAEAEAHGVALEQVHFHEVGAADSILDIVGCSFLLDALRATRFFATPLALGNGTVQSEHGELPVPAPATAHLICGLPVYASSQQGELTTPTGAALARVFITDWAPLPPMTPLAIGYGAGSRDLPGAANVVRIIAGEAASLTGFSEQDGFIVEGCVLLETNIDHLAPEALAFACEELLRAGALDVWQESITMKKGRLAIRLSVLSQASEAQRLAEAVSALTGSLGVRGSYVERTVAPRTMVTLETRFGPVPFKAAKIDAPVGRISWLRPEHDAVAALARQHGLDYNALYRELARLASYPDIEHRP
jgi:uncharacterized protein (TIGR00299 family) protein